MHRDALKAGVNLHLRAMVTLPCVVGIFASIEATMAIAFFVWIGGMRFPDIRVFLDGASRSRHIAVAICVMLGAAGGLMIQHHSTRHTTFWLVAGIATWMLGSTALLYLFQRWSVLPVSKRPVF